MKCSHIANSFYSPVQTPAAVVSMQFHFNNVALPCLSIFKQSKVIIPSLSIFRSSACDGLAFWMLSRERGDIVTFDFWELILLVVFTQINVFSFFLFLLVLLNAICIICNTCDFETSTTSVWFFFNPNPKPLICFCLFNINQMFRKIIQIRTYSCKLIFL